MFKKFFEKTKKKAEDAIDKTVQNADDTFSKANEALTDAKKLINYGERKIAVLGTLAAGFLILGITASIFNLVVNAKTLERLRTQEILENIMKHQK